MNSKDELTYLIKFLISENDKKIKLPNSYENQKKLLRSLMNLRPPKPIDTNFLKIQDSFLTKENMNQELFDESQINYYKFNKKIALWKGDITTLKVDAIVNACNKQLLGCFIPLHNCIDNIIHSKAGVQLRQECFEIIKNQGHYENEGDAKITSAYNLPSKYVIHTVGPQIINNLKKEDCQKLLNCYFSSLTLADKNNIKSIAFPCISTGVYNFPEEYAAKIAINTVNEYFKVHKNTNIKKVIFNVYTQRSKDIYQKLLL